MGGHVKPLTARQAEVLGFIRRFIGERGMPPTIREIRRAFGFSSTNGASDHLRALARKGAIDVSFMKSRGLRVLVDATPPPAKIAIFWIVPMPSTSGAPATFSVLVDGRVVVDSRDLGTAVALAKEVPALCGASRGGTVCASPRSVAEPH